MADSYVNTRTIMGDQEAFDALIAGELEDLVEDGVTSFGDNSAYYILYNDDYLKNLTLPNVAVMHSMAIGSCKSLKKIDIYKNCNIGSYNFKQCYHLDSLILRGNAMAQYKTENLWDTNIYDGVGAVYVPSDLVNTYRANTYWSKYNVLPIDDYPYNFETISDTWSDIFASENDGTYASKYSLGDTKSITIGDNKYYVQIVAFDKDILSDDSGSAKITWLLRTTYKDEHAMTADVSSSYIWNNSYMRSWLIDSVFALFPIEVKNAIKEVKKTSSNFNTPVVTTTNDKIWLPSVRELYDSGNDRESSGVSYTTYFDSYEKIKRSHHFWLRSHAYGSYSSFAVGGGSAPSSNTGTISSGVCFGFCT